MVPRYSVGTLLIVMTVAAALSAVVASLLGLPVGSLGRWLFWPGVYLIPSAITLAVLLGLATLNAQVRWSAVASAVAVGFAMASPGVCAWYTWEIAGDRTANIGAGLLVFGQAFGAPFIAVFVYCIARPFELSLRDPRDKQSACREDASTS